MKLISQISDLKAVSGGYGYIYDEFVTADTIFYESVYSAVGAGLIGGILGFVFGSAAAGTAGGIALGSLAAAGMGYFCYYHNDYSDIEPNTWVRWDVTVTVVYY